MKCEIMKAIGAMMDNVEERQKEKSKLVSHLQRRPFFSFIDHASHSNQEGEKKESQSNFLVDLKADELAGAFFFRCLLLHLSNLSDSFSLSIYSARSSEKEKSLFWKKNRGTFYVSLYFGTCLMVCSVAHSLSLTHTPTAPCFLSSPRCFYRKEKEKKIVVSISLSDTNFRANPLCAGVKF